MDSNVSKNTFSHKFFKLRFTRENGRISIEDLLKCKLGSTINFYQQTANLSLNPQSLATILEPKITLLESSIELISSNSKRDLVFFTSQLTPIVYGCSIAFVLSSYSTSSPQTIAKILVNLLDTEQSNDLADSYLNLNMEITEAGGINFFLDSQSLANWLQQLLIFIQTKNLGDRDLAKVCPPDKTPANLFPVQYIHSRCCSLLRLAARERLIILKDNNFHNLAWQLIQPKSISWLDAQNNLWLKEEIEFDLLRQILLVTDSFASKSANWAKLALNLSDTVAMFLAESCFMGEKQKYPHRAIARLGLIAITQYWLQRILVEKLNVAAPTSF